MIAPASSEGQRAIARFRIPAEMKVELFAAEPMLANPVTFCFDQRGRVYVAETYRINHGAEDNRDSHMNWLDDDLAAQTVDDRLVYYKKYLGDRIDQYTTEHDRIRLLEDCDGDGKADKSTVFADGFNGVLDGIGSGLLAYRGDVFYTCIPHLWRLRDVDGDGRADQKLSLHYGYGVRTALQGHDLHGLVLGPDGKLYFSIGDRGCNISLADRKVANIESGSVFRCNLDGSNLEIFATGLRNPQELAFDDYGDLFTCDNNSDSGDKSRLVYVVEGGDSGWRMAFQYLSDRGPWNREQLWHTQHVGQAAYIVPPVAYVADGPAGLVHYPGTGFQKKYRDCFFLVDFRGDAGKSGIHAIRVRPKGAGFELSQDDKFWWSILATDVDFGPDGAMYASDWVQGWVGSGKGRIYRLFDSTSMTTPLVQEVKRLLNDGLAAQSNTQLVSLLSHADHRIRQEAQFELARRKAANELTQCALDGPTLLARIHALWAMGQIGPSNTDIRLCFSQLECLLDDPVAEVRTQATKVLAPVSIIHDAKFIELLHDTSPRVRFFAAMALAQRKPPEAIGPLVKMLEENNDADPVLRHAGVLGLAACSTSGALVKLAANPSAPYVLPRLLRCGD